MARLPDAVALQLFSHGGIAEQALHQRIGGAQLHAGGEQGLGEADLAVVDQIVLAARERKTKPEAQPGGVLEQGAVGIEAVGVQVVGVALSGIGETRQSRFRTGARGFAPTLQLIEQCRGS